MQSVAHLGADSFTGSNRAIDLREGIMFHIGLQQVTSGVLIQKLLTGKVTDC